MKVFVLDDSEVVCKIISGILMELGCEVSDFTSADEAMMALEKASPDMILLDLVMPDVSGFEVVEKIKKVEKLEKIPLIALTSKSDDDDVLEGYKKGFDYYITKPTNKKQLQYAINLVAKQQDNSSVNKGFHLDS